MPHSPPIGNVCYGVPGVLPSGVLGWAVRGVVVPEVVPLDEPPLEPLLEPLLDPLLEPLLDDVEVRGAPVLPLPVPPCWYPPPFTTRPCGTGLDGLQASFRTITTGVFPKYQPVPNPYPPVP